MRKRKSLKLNEEDSDGSGQGAEPEEFQDSGEDWTPDADSVCSFASCLFSYQITLTRCNCV